MADWNSDWGDSEWQDPGDVPAVKRTTRPSSGTAGENEQSKPDSSDDWGKWNDDKWDDPNTLVRTEAKPSPKTVRTVVKKVPPSRQGKLQKKQEELKNEDDGKESKKNPVPQNVDAERKKPKETVETVSVSTADTDAVEAEEQHRKDAAHKKEEEDRIRAAQKLEEERARKVAQEEEARAAEARAAEARAAEVRAAEARAAEARAAEARAAEARAAEEKRLKREAEEEAERQLEIEKTKQLEAEQQLRIAQQREEEERKQKEKKEKQEELKRKKEENRIRKEQERLQKEAAERLRIEKEEEIRRQEEEKHALQERERLEELQRIAEREAAEARLTELARQEQERAAAEIEIHRRQLEEEEQLRKREAEWKLAEEERHQAAVLEERRHAREVETARLEKEHLTAEAMRREQERVTAEEIRREQEEEEDIREEEETSRLTVDSVAGMNHWETVAAPSVGSGMQQEVLENENKEDIFDVLEEDLREERRNSFHQPRNKPSQKTQVLPRIQTTVASDSPTEPQALTEWDASWNDDWNDNSTLSNIETNTNLIPLTVESLENHNAAHQNHSEDIHFTNSNRISTGSTNPYSTEMAFLNDPRSSTFIDSHQGTSFSVDKNSRQDIGLSLSSVHSERSFEDELKPGISPSDNGDVIDTESDGSHDGVNGFASEEGRNSSSQYSYEDDVRPRLRDRYDSHSTDSGDERRDGSHEQDNFSPSMSPSNYSSHSEDGEESHISTDTVNSAGSNYTMTDPMEKVMRAFGMLMPGPGSQFSAFSAPLQDQAHSSYGYPLPTLAPPTAFFPTTTAPPIFHSTEISSPAHFLRKHLYPHAVGDYLQNISVSINNVDSPPLLEVFETSLKKRIRPEIAKFPHDLSGNVSSTDDKVSVFCKFMEELAVEFGSLNAAKRDEGVMWSLLSLLVRHGSNVRNFAISEILMGASRDPGSFDSSASLANGGSFASELYPGERKLSAVRRNLAAGLIPRACKSAEEQGRTPLAFMLLSLPSVIKTNNKSALCGFMRYLDRTVAPADPIFTACSLMCGVSPRVAECVKNWMAHVAVVIGCGVLIPTAAKIKFFLTLAEFFDGSGKPVARDVLYLLSRPAPRVSHGALESKLIGTDFSGSSLSGKISKNLDKFFMTEIFVYVANKTSRDLSASFTSPLQVEYLNYLLTGGATSEAAAYLNYISQSILSTKFNLEPNFVISFFTQVVNNRGLLSRDLLSRDQPDIFPLLVERIHAVLQDQSRRRVEIERKMGEERRAAESARQAVLKRMEEKEKEENRIRSEMAAFEQRRSPSVQSNYSDRSAPESFTNSSFPGHISITSFVGPVEHVQNDRSDRGPSAEPSLNSRPQSARSRSHSTVFPQSSHGLFRTDEAEMRLTNGMQPVQVESGHASNFQTLETSNSIQSRDVTQAVEVSTQPSIVDPESGSGVWTDEDDFSSFYRLPKKQEEVEETNAWNDNANTVNALNTVNAPSVSLYGQSYEYGRQEIPSETGVVDYQRPETNAPLTETVPLFSSNAPLLGSNVPSAPQNDHYSDFSEINYSESYPESRSALPDIEGGGDRRDSDASSWAVAERRLSVESVPQNPAEYGTVYDQQQDTSTDLSGHQPNEYYHLEYSQNQENYQTDYWNYNNVQQQPGATDWSQSQQGAAEWSQSQQGVAEWSQSQQGVAESSKSQQPYEVQQYQTDWNQAQTYAQQPVPEYFEQNYQQGFQQSSDVTYPPQPETVEQNWNNGYQTIPLTTTGEQQQQQRPPNHFQHQTPYVNGPDIPDEEEEQRNAQQNQSTTAPPTDNKAKPGLMGRFTGFFRKGSAESATTAAPPVPNAGTTAAPPIPTLPAPSVGGPPMFPSMGGVPPGPFMQFAPPPNQYGAGPMSSGWSNANAGQPNQPQPITSPLMFSAPGGAAPPANFGPPSGAFGVSGFPGHGGVPSGNFIGAYQPNSQAPQLNLNVMPGQNVPPLY